MFFNYQQLIEIKKLSRVSLIGKPTNLLLQAVDKLKAIPHEIFLSANAFTCHTPQACINHSADAAELIIQ